MTENEKGQFIKTVTRKTESNDLYLSQRGAQKKTLLQALLCTGKSQP